MKTPVKILMAAAALLVSLSCQKTLDPSQDNGGGQGAGGNSGDSDIPTYTSTIYKQNSEGYPIFRIPAIVTSAKGTLLCFCEGRAAYDDFGDIDMVVKRSEDQGKTWQPLIKIADAGNDRYGNPVPVVLEDGRILLVFGWSKHESSMSTKVFTTFSSDDGKTWSTPVEITSQIKKDTRSIYQTGPVHGIVKQREPHKGRIIVPIYGTTKDNLRSAVIYSDDNAKTWKHGGGMDYNLGGEPTVAERGDGSLIMNVRDNDDDPLRHQSVSNDGGETWGPHTSTNLIEPKGCQGALLTYDLGTSASNSVILFSNPNNTESRRHGSVKLSKNGGSSYSLMWQYTMTETSGMYSSYSDLCIVSGDVIGVAFESGYKNNTGIQFKSVHFSDIKEPYTGTNK